MEIQELLIPELQYETQLTEKFLSRIPEDKLNWRPHKKSMTMKELANHLVEIPTWITGTMDFEEMELDGYEATNIDTVKAMISALKKNAAEAEVSLKKPSDTYQKSWKMKKGGKVVLEMPRYTVLRSMVLNQMPHHRAQLGVYLRLLDESVPATYGPSADENE